MNCNSNIFVCIYSPQRHCVVLLYLYSFPGAICRPSDHSVRRPRAEIRTRVEGSTIEVGMLNTRPQLLAYSFDVFRLYCHNQTMPMPSEINVSVPNPARAELEPMSSQCHAKLEKWQAGGYIGEEKAVIRQYSNTPILQYAPELQHWSSTTGS